MFLHQPSKFRINNMTHMYECMYISKIEVIYLTPFKKRHMYMYIYTARYSISYLVRYAPYFQY